MEHVLGDHEFEYIVDGQFIDTSPYHTHFPYTPHMPYTTRFSLRLSIITVTPLPASLLLARNLPRVIIILDPTELFTLDRLQTYQRITALPLPVLA